MRVGRRGIVIDEEAAIREQGLRELRPGLDLLEYIEAPSERCGCVVTLSRDDTRVGENAELLAVEGRIRIEGDPGLAMKMRSCFRRST